MKTKHNISRSFRVKVVPDDHIKLKILRNSEVVMDFENVFVSDISLTGISFSTNKQEKSFKKYEDLSFGLSFEDFHIVINGTVVRSVIDEQLENYAVKFNFNEGQTFDLFFEKFISTFNHERVKEELLSVLNEQSRSGFVAEDLLKLILNLKHDIQSFSNFDHFKEIIFKQLAYDLKASDVSYFDLSKNHAGKDNNISIGFNLQDNIHIFEDLGSLVETCHVEGKPVCAISYGDKFLDSVGVLLNINYYNVLVMPVLFDKEITGFVVINREDTLKYSKKDLYMSAQVAELISSLITKRSAHKPENIKFLNPKKPRQFAMIGKNEKIQNIRRLVNGTKNDYKPVFLEGNKGTGKKLLAQIIHSESRLSHKEFLSLDADRTKHKDLINKLVSSNKVPLEFAGYGTVFITNICSLTEETLSLLNENTIQSPNEIRIIISPGMSEKIDKIPEGLMKAVGNNKFQLPDLKDRKEDIPELVNFLVKIESKKRGFLPKTISKNIIDIFESHEWEGNIGEIKTAVSRLVLYFSDKEYISELPPDSYHIFSKMNNTDYGINDKSQKILQLLEETSLTKEDLLLYFQKSLVMKEMEKHGGSLKKTALSLGKPLQYLEEVLEHSTASDDLDRLVIKKVS